MPAPADDRRLLADKLRAVGAQLRHLPRAWRLVWAAAKQWTLVWLALLAVQGLLPVAVVYLTRDLVDAIAALVRGGGAAAITDGLPAWSALQPALIPAAAIAGVLLAIELAKSIGSWISEAQGKLVEEHVSALIHGKSAAVDLAFYESPDFHDHLHRARAEAGYRPVALLENFGSVIQNGITLAAMAVVLLPYGVWMSLALLASTAPALIVVLRYALRAHRLQQQT